MDPITAITLGIAGIKSLSQLVSAMRARALQTGELTAEQDAAFTRELDDLNLDPAWKVQPSAPPGGYGYGYGYGYGGH